MKKLIIKIKSIFFTKESDEDFKIEKKFIKSNMTAPSNAPIPMGTTHGDRKRYFNNYNTELLNRISEIKANNG
jgi:hypothetical protein